MLDVLWLEPGDVVYLTGGREATVRRVVVDEASGGLMVDVAAAGETTPSRVMVASLFRSEEDARNVEVK